MQFIIIIIKLIVFFYPRSDGLCLMDEVKSFSRLFFCRWSNDGQPVSGWWLGGCSVAWAAVHSSPSVNITWILPSFLNQR